MPTYNTRQDPLAPTYHTGGGASGIAEPSSPGQYYNAARESNKREISMLVEKMGEQFQDMFQWQTEQLRKEINQARDIGDLRTDNVAAIKNDLLDAIRVGVEQQRELDWAG